MTTRLPTGAARSCLAVATFLLAGSAQALTFISPIGEPFHSPAGGKPPEEIWFAQADANHDGRMTRAEFLADAGRFFRVLDVNHDSVIGSEEVDRYEQEIAPEVSGFGTDDGGKAPRPRTRTRNPYQTDEAGDPEKDLPPAYDSRGVGASRFGYFDLPEPVAAMDLNFDRRVTPKEFADAAYQRFSLLDANHDGVLTLDELPRLGGARPDRRPPGGPEAGGGGRPGGGHRPPHMGQGGGGYR
jgi:hypothetical protein